MNLFLVLFIILASMIVFPLLLKWREASMRKLSKKFGLSFKSEQPGFLEFYLTLYRGKKDFNHIQGNLNGHSIHIYDKFWFSLFISFPSRTVIEVDGIPRGEKDFTPWDIIWGGFINLTSTSEIQMILQNLRSARG